MEVCVCVRVARPIGRKYRRQKRLSELGIGDNMCLNKHTSNRPEDVMGDQMILLRYKTRHLKMIFRYFSS